MDDYKRKWLLFLENFMRSAINRRYNNDFDKFVKENANLSLFLQNHEKFLNNTEASNVLKNYINQNDYAQILSFIRKNYDNNKSNEIIVHSNNVRDDISFLPISLVNSTILNEQNKEIYDEAIGIAIRQPDSHSIMIGVKANNDLIRCIKSKDGSMINWKKEDETKLLVNAKEGKQKIIKPSTRFEEKGFSNALILAFIIGSIIGIVFLVVYSKFIK